MNIRRQVKFWILMGLLNIFACGSYAQSQVADSLPNFEQCFALLSKNRTLYNAYNDSIFLIHDHDQWVNFFRRRALKNHQIFAANKEIINTIMTYFAQDTERIPQEAYDRLFKGLYGYTKSERNDPFITVAVGEILQKYYQKRLCPDSMNHELLLNIWMSTNEMQIYNVDKDMSRCQRAYQYLLRNLQAENFVGFDDYPKLKAYTLWNLVRTQFLLRHVQTLDEFYACVSELRDMLKQESLVKSLEKEKAYRSIRNAVLAADENVVRNVYMVDSTIMDKQKADSLMNIIVARNLKTLTVSSSTRLRTLLMMIQLKRITAKEALEGSLKRYKLIREYIKKKRLEPNELADYIRPFFSFFYLNEIADISYAKKRRIVKSMCKDIEMAYTNRMDRQNMTEYVKFLNQLTTYPRVTKYLKPAERVHFLNALNVATQVTTYAHSVHVSIIAEELMKGILAYQPELLIGALGDLQVSEIVRNQKKYLDFIHDAGMYHDIGKNSIASVVNNDYRPLTDEEFAIIKQHPELGLQYLELSPKLLKYRDTMLGHHKWYNGKGGYPMSFDNTKSPQRILIDIVTLSDCLQAATERVGRNYKGDKTFDTVMGEFRRDAGVRYNPDLVNLIDEHPDLAKKLAGLIEGGWAEIYYNIYSQYFGK